ncbi:MAG: hypothetical protein AAB294_00525 [Pseudomonadota bacterium]
MKKTNFDRYLENQMQDPRFVVRFERAGKVWEVKEPADASWPKPPLRIASNAHPPKDNETGLGHSQ